MTIVDTIHVGDIGTTFKAELKDAGVAFDPTDATTTQFHFKSPSGVIIERDAEITTSGTGSRTRWYLIYTTEAADITDGLNSEEGEYSWQALIEFTDGSHFHTTIATYDVEPNLED
jgi:hypothetical protein